MLRYGSCTSAHHMYQTQNAASEHCRSDMLPTVSRVVFFDSYVDQNLNQECSDVNLQSFYILCIVPSIALLTISLHHEPKVRGQEPVIAEKEWLSFHLWCIRST